MKKIGIKLADGSFYPILEEGSPEKKQLNLTTAKDNQTIVQVDLYRSETSSMEDAEYVDSLEIKKLKKHPNGEPDINLDISIDEDGKLFAEIHDPETGKDSSTTVSLISKTIEQLNDSSDIALAELDESLSNSIQEESFAADNDDDLTLDPNSLNIDSLIEEESTIDDNTILSDSEEISTDLSNDQSTIEESFDDSANISTDDLTTDFSNTQFSDEDFSVDETTMSEPTFDTTESNDDTISFSDESNEFTTSDFSTENASTDESNFNDFSSTDLSTDDLSSTDLSADFSTTETSTDNLDFNEDLFNQDFTETDNVENNVENSAGLDFSDILDKETKEGNAAGNSNTEEIRKKTKLPVLICTICAVICIIAVLLILFVIPSKFNIANKKNGEQKIENTEQSTQCKEQEKPTPKHEAQEDKIVVAPAQEVVPEIPSTKNDNAKNITYKLKWGDTLWDLAKSYYNNPWKYPKIAKYNGIKDPDYIISGTVITIPKE